MKLPKARLQELAAEWRAARRAYPLYAAILKTFDLGLGPCSSLESPVDRDDEKSLEEMRGWLTKMDSRCSAAQIRQIVQNSSLGSEPCLRTLIQRQLSKPEKTPEDRFKLDFLLVQYFAECASRTVILGKVGLQDVAQVLEPVLGECPLSTPKFLEPLNAFIEQISECKALKDLISRGVVDAGRKLKEQAGGMYFGPSVLVAFVRYNFLLRRAFVRLLHADIEVIRATLRDLERADISRVDCSNAGFSASEPIGDLRKFCQSWRKVFVADYANGPSFESIVGIRNAVEAALKTKNDAVKARSETRPAAKTPVKVTNTPAAAVRTVSSEVAAIETARARVETVLSPKPAKQEAKAGFEVQRAVAHIAKQVAVASQNKGAAAVTVELGGSQIVLSSWELLAFTKSAPISLALQRAVVARTLVEHAFAQLKKTGVAPDLENALQLGHSVAAEMQERIAQARDAKHLNDAVEMAASSKRLMTVMGEAERCLTVSK
jgi:hypothetical protein